MNFTVRQGIDEKQGRDRFSVIIAREKEAAERQRKFRSECYAINTSSSLYSEASKRNCPEAIVGMKILHQDYGELTITEVEHHAGKTIICVVDSHGETSRKT